jgi:hypothetical protein
VVLFRLWLVFSFAVGAITASLVFAQSKQEEFPKALSVESATPTPTPSASSKTKSAKRKSKAKKRADSTPRPTPHKTPAPTESPARSAKPKASPGKSKTTAKKKRPQSPTPKKKKKKASSPVEETPSLRGGVSPRSAEHPEIRPAISVVPVTSPPPVTTSTAAVDLPAEEPAQVTIEKSGYEEHRSFFARLFGLGRQRSSSGGGYSYLSRSVRAAIDRAPVARARWQFIVVHNSGTRQGNAAVFDYYHRNIRRMRNGLAYHFVIGNGTSTGNGEIEVGDRWRRQINGGHVHSDYLNNIALGICLVGDFNRDQPTRAQLDCCEELIRYLRQRCGKIDNHYAIVKPHREMNPPRWPTDCPGDAFPYSWFRRF